MRSGRAIHCWGERRMEPAMGFEPATACLQNRCSTIELHRRGVQGTISQGDWQTTHICPAVRSCNTAKDGGSPGTRTRNQLIKSQLLYH